MPRDSVELATDTSLRLLPQGDLPYRDAPATSRPVHIYCDFEYRCNGQQPILGCFLVQETGDRYEFDLRDDFGEAPNGLIKRGSCDGDGVPQVERLRRFIAHYTAQGAVWIAYAAQAEIGCLLVCGCDVADMKWICLLAEGRQITASHASFRLKPSETNLLGTLDILGIPTRGSRARKTQMRDLILATDQYTDEEWAAIVDYCWSDIEPLPTAWQAITSIYHLAKCQYGELVAIFRGDYLRACAIMEHRSRGFPIDVPLLERLYANRLLVMRTLAERAVVEYGPVYLFDKRGRVRFNFGGLKAHIKSRPYPVDWEVTAKAGRPRMDEEYLDDLIARYPEYKPLKDTYMLLGHFARTDLRPLVNGNFIKGVSLPFHTTTGRNQPKVSAGFILNMRPWLRSMVRPEPGHVLVAADWSQQEVVVAAALSGDRLLADALATGDVYLATAKMAGAVPDDASKKSHPVQRQMFKACVLGLSYGMQYKSLGHNIYLSLRDQALQLGLPMPDLDDCIYRAKDILAWHRSTFRDFWAWNEYVVEWARRDGYLRTVDGWTTFADLNSSATRLGNFPVQANAAMILRQAVKYLSKFPQIEYVCSLHDALYIYCNEDDEVEHTNILVRCMTAATRAFMRGVPQPLDIKVDVKHWTHATGYTDERDTSTLPAIIAVLDAHQR